jgi:Sulfatase-modifying factor enzyme 1
LEILTLATDFESEALHFEPSLRERLRRFTEDALENPDPELHVLAAEHMLAKRLQNMVPISAEVSIDRSPLSQAEYQLFVDQSWEEGRNYVPDHWNHRRFPRTMAKHPIVGVRARDAEAFCRWLEKKP